MIRAIDTNDYPYRYQWSRCNVVVVTTTQLYSTKLELWFGEGSNPASGMSKICDVENL